MKVKDDHRSKFSNLSNWKEEAWKKKYIYQGFNGASIETLIFFQASSFQLLKLENLLRWSSFTFMLSLCKHACKEVCDLKQGIDPYPYLLGRVTDDGQIS